MMKPAHDHRFDVVWKGAWYQLASLSEHIRAKVALSGDKWLLFDRMSRTHLVPRSEVAIPAIPANPLPRK